MSELSQTPAGARRLPLARYLWQSYLRAAIIPLLVIELGFIGVYWVSSFITYERNAEALGAISREDLARTAQREADAIAEKLGAVGDLTRVFAAETARALRTPAPAAATDDDARHAYGADGVYYTTREGVSAGFYSGIVPVGPAERDKVRRTAAIDPLMQAIKAANPLVAQLYLNTHDSYNRIHPYFEVLTQYPAKMDIPSYNFYYEADAAHDPERRAVWTDAYVDPAGSGWMVSSIAPVYGGADGNFLEGVVGIDVTVDTIVRRVLNLQLPWQGYALLVGRDGTILALPPRGERDFGLKELTAHSYDEAIRADTFKPDDFNVHKRADLAVLGRALKAGGDGVVELALGSGRTLAGWSTVAGPGWQLVVLAPEHEILAGATALRERLSLVGWLMIASLMLFYVGFLIYLRSRARAMTARVAAPLGDIEALIRRIGGGDYEQSEPDYRIAELQTVGTHLVDMGRRLGAAYAAMVEAERSVRAALDKERELGEVQRQFINVVSHEFRTPLTIIDGVAQTFERRADRLGPDKIIERARSLRASVRRLVDVLESALSFSRLESSQLTHAFGPVAFAAVLQEVVQTETVAYPQHRFEIDGALPAAVHGDAGLLRVMLSAVLDNAARYSPQAGTVTIRASTGTDDCVHLDIHDQGPGIPADELPRVRERFYRGSAGLASHGAGLGLYLVEQFVQLSGGRLDIDSPPGQGTVVRLVLPVHGPRAAAAA
ncbi:MAG: sensor histidine kinase [Proteobacteria bacterium]|nr:sensor histidine kinase [Pseudomonadota bacterium]